MWSSPSCLQLAGGLPAATRYFWCNHQECSLRDTEYLLLDMYGQMFHGTWGIPPPCLNTHFLLCHVLRLCYGNRRRCAECVCVQEGGSCPQACWCLNYFAHSGTICGKYDGGMTSHRNFKEKLTKCQKIMTSTTCGVIFCTVTSACDLWLQDKFCSSGLC